MGIDLKTGQRTEATLEEDRAADEKRAADMRQLDRQDREREEAPRLEVRTRCAGCATPIVVEIPAPYCDLCI